MTTLIAPRTRRRVGRDAPIRQAVQPAAAEANLIVWHAAADGIWTGRFDLLDAGTVRRTPAGYAVEAWDGSPEGIFPTLAEAQLSLEPAHRARLREQTEATRHGVLRAGFAIVGLAAVAVAAATGVLTALPL
jgi:hypothetical protein